MHESVDSLRRDVCIVAFVELLQLTCKKDVGMGLYVCLPLCYMPSPLSLHTAMPI